MELKKIIIGVNLTVLFVILVAGFYPFEFKPANKVYRLKNNGVIINHSGMIYEANDESRAPILSKMSVNSELSIEILLKPLSPSSYNISSILSFYDDNDFEIFMLAQWKSNLILRRRIVQLKNKYTYHEVDVPDTIFPGKKLFIALTMTQKGTSVYIDGIPKSFFPKYLITPDNNKFKNSRIMIGNNPSIKYPLHGEIYGLAIYNCAFSATDISIHFMRWKKNDFKYLSNESGIIELYPMNEKSGSIIGNIITKNNNMYIPKNLFAIKKTFLGMTWHHFWRNKNFYKDLIINILGFIPFGFFLLALFVSYYKRNSINFFIITILIGTSLSLFIELIQAYMPARSSDIIDLISNTFGTILGVILFHIIYTHYLPKMKKTGLIRFI